MILPNHALKAFFAVGLLAVAQIDLQACTACFGQSDSSMAKGMNMGIFTLLLVITSVLFTIAGFFVFLIRRSAQIAEAHEQVAAHQLSPNRTNA